MGDWWGGAERQTANWCCSAYGTAAGNMWVGGTSSASSIPAGNRLQPGATIMLYNAFWKKFTRMSETGMDTNTESGLGPYDFKSGWPWEQFTVVDAGSGQVALWSSSHNRFMRMNAGAGIMDYSSVKDINALPSNWSWERFTEKDAGNGEIALHNTVHNRFVRTNNAIMDVSSTKNLNDLPSSWTYERYRVVPHDDYA